MALASQAKAISLTLFDIPKHARADDEQCLQISVPHSEGIRLWFSM